PRLREDELRRIRKVLLVVSDPGEIPVDGPVEADVEARERAALESRARLLHQARFRSDGFPSDLPGYQKLIARGFGRLSSDSPERPGGGDRDAGEGKDHVNGAPPHVTSLCRPLGSAA